MLNLKRNRITEIPIGWINGGKTREKNMATGEADKHPAMASICERRIHENKVYPRIASVAPLTIRTSALL